MNLANWTYAPLIISAGSAMLVLFLVYLLWKRTVVRKVIPGRGPASLLMTGSEKIRTLKNIIIILSVIIFTFVLLRPQWGDRVREIPSEGRDILVVLDVSQSMLARDAGGTRLQRARDAVRILADSQSGDRMGLVLFAGDAFLQCPLTADLGAFMMFLDAAGPDSMSVQGTDLGAALEKAGNVFTEKRLTSRSLVFITDGEDHEGKAIAMADKFREMGVALYCIGIGREEGVTITSGDDNNSTQLTDLDGKAVMTRKNSGLLKDMAQRTGGEYIDITDGFSGLGKVQRAIAGEENRQAGTRRIHEKEDRYALFVFMLVLLLSLELMLPEYVLSERKSVIRNMLKRLVLERGTKR